MSDNTLKKVSTTAQKELSTTAQERCLQEDHEGLMFFFAQSFPDSAPTTSSSPTVPSTLTVIPSPPDTFSPLIAPSLSTFIIPSLFSSSSHTSTPSPSSNSPPTSVPHNMLTR
jgi:hypothetical protein